MIIDTQILLLQFLIGTTNKETVTQHFIKELYKSIVQFDFIDLSKRSYKSLKFYVPDTLQTCDKVWFRVDYVQRPLKAPYSGTYTALLKHPNIF